MLERKFEIQVASKYNIICCFFWNGIQSGVLFDFWTMNMKGISTAVDKKKSWVDGCILFNHQWCVLEFYCWFQRFQPVFLLKNTTNLGKIIWRIWLLPRFFCSTSTLWGINSKKQSPFWRQQYWNPWERGTFAPWRFAIVEAGFACAEYASIQVAVSSYWVDVWKLWGCLQKGAQILWTW